MRWVHRYLSFVFFFTGHLISITLLHGDAEIWYTPYNWCMNMSWKFDKEDVIWQTD